MKNESDIPFNRQRKITCNHYAFRKKEKISCEHRFVDRKIELDTEDYQDMKIIRFLNTVNVVKFIDVDWSDEE